jgi:hypothetical protein
MDVFALILRLKEEGAAAVKSATDQLKKSFDNTSKSATGLDKAMGSLKKAAMAYVSVSTVTSVLSKIVKESSNAQFEQARLAQVLTATGNAAGQTLEALNEHANALQRISTFGAGDINQAQARLLTYNNIVGESFPRATQAVLDYAAAFEMDLVAASEAVGKALNFPSVGMAALSKQGFILTDAQKALIKEFEETNRLAEAQAIIFEELESVTKGQAEAVRNTLGGALKALGEAYNGLFEITREGSQDTIDALNKLTDWLNSNSGAVANFAIRTGLAIASLAGTIISFAAGLSAAIINVAFLLSQTLRPFQFLPVIGDKIRKMLDESNIRAKTYYDQAQAIKNSFGGISKAVEKTNTELAKTVVIGQRAAATIGGIAGAGAASGAAGSTTIRGAMPGIAMTERVLPPELTPISPAVLERVKASTALAIDQAKVSMMEQMEQASMEFAANIANTLIGSLAAGIETAVATGSIGEGFKALGETLLSGLGSALQMFGTQAILAGKLMERFMNAMATLNPFAAVAAGIGMVALGAALKGAAKAAFGGGSQGAGGMGMSTLSVGGGAMQTGGALRFVPTTAGQASQMQPRGAVTVNATIIGPNDPTAQRQIAALVDNAARRGLMQGPALRTT